MLKVKHISGFLRVGFILITSILYSQDQTSQKLFDLGNQFYAEGKYQEAAKSYQSILNEGLTSAELHYNLANTYHKLNELPESIYHYEKALQLDPSNKDIQNNLAFVKKATLDVIDDVPQIGITRFINQIAHSFSADGWAWLAVLFSFLGVTGFILYYQSTYEGKKRMFFILSMLFFLFGIFSLVFAFRTSRLNALEKYAIIFAEEVEVQNEPNRRGDQLFILHEGTKVKVLEDFDNWIQIELADGRKGWLLSDTLKVI
ncbi:tetratricopeptide repeat protein [Gangjinia marincola]|uniref:Tetratricopeptide repeat protein n=1 Tax=Gangjinia marincola TaxID=578463 RepID=A0ABN1MI13_9FLAO